MGATDSPATTPPTGKQARAGTPRSAHAEWAPAADRRDPVDILEEQARTRVPELVPIRYGRMLRSPLAFFRGAAAIMAADLAATPVTGSRVQLCGDAHLANFGGFAAPDRTIVFDVNDFDETLPGPWEWDVKRLAASFAVAGRERGFDEDSRRAIVEAAVREYRLAMRRFATMRTIDVWYSRLELADQFERWSEGASRSQRKGLQKTLAKARSKDSLRAFAKLTRDVDGEPRIISDPPLIVPLEELVKGKEARRFEEEITLAFEGYRDTLPADRRHLLDGYRPVHMAHKVVGVGSVGTRAWILLLLGHDAGDPLFLQIKEAGPSVLEPMAGESAFETHGQRVVEGQRLMQAASDVFLGWLRVEGGVEGKPHDYYVRQLWDNKGSAPLDAMRPRPMRAYAEICGSSLARAHARSGDPDAIGGYLGRGDRFDRALAHFAETYADQNETDYSDLAAAVRTGAVAAETAESVV
ncbi:MAG: hypothetical protein QOJ85_460 [Solirubrobacteraceae bacterium]|nr:hypothetical protein [Solirubrobacteraceae bacterium]